MLVAPHSTLTNTLPLRVAAIHEAVSIFDVFERMHVPTLRPETQQMRCPFHQDHSPSARVYAEQNVLYCFTEQKRWDVIACVQEHFKLSFQEALAWLEQEFGVGAAPQSLTSRIKVVLLAKPKPQVTEIAQTIESRLKSRKQALGFERYTRGLLALDLLVHDSPTLKAAELQRRLEAVSRVAAR